MVILFDGVCNMCNGFVNFVIKRDKKNLYKFASLQSVYGRGLLAHYGYNTLEYETMFLYDGKNIQTRSDAVMTVVSSLGGLWKLCAIYKIVPRFIRNGMYDFMARRRYRIFGRSETCMVPTPEVKSRFVDDLPFPETKN
jgi:predicted DCC family thiol-disulfide oxidoreductase YuxK